MKIITQIHQILATPSDNQLDALYALIDNHISDPFYRADLEVLEDAVCGFYEVSYTDLLTYDRSRKKPEARQVMYYLLFTYKGFTSEAIAHRYQKTRQAVEHGISKIEGLIQVESCPELYRIKQGLLNAA